MSWFSRKKQEPDVDPNAVFLRVDANEFNESLQYAVMAALTDGPVSFAYSQAVQELSLKYVRSLLPESNYDQEIQERVEEVLGNLKTWEGKIEDAVKQAIRVEISAAVTKIVKEQIPLSEHYQEIEAQCREQLRRWPALKDDENMKSKVAVTILNSFIR